MRALTWSLFGLFIVAAASYAQSPPPDLQKAIDARAAAQNAGDEQGWARYTTDDFIVVNTEGAVLTKADRMGTIKGNKIANPPAPTEVKFRIYGDTVIQTNLGGAAAGPARFTTVWVKQNGMWKVASVHSTRVTKK